MDLAAVGTFIQNVGFPIALVIYFVHRDAKRDQRSNAKEDANAAAFKELNDRQYKLTEMAIEAVATSNEVKREIAQTQRELKTVIERFCDKK